MKFKIVFIGGLTNGKKLLEFLNNDKDSLVELIVTYPKKQKGPRLPTFAYLLGFILVLIWQCDM